MNTVPDTPRNWQSFVVNAMGAPCAVPALCCNFYFPAPVDGIAACLAEMVDLYAGFIGEGCIKTYLAPSGYYKLLTKGQFAKDLNRLRKFPVDREGERIEYNSEADGIPGAFGLYLEATKLDPQFEGVATNLLRLDFHPDCTSGAKLDELLDLMMRLVDRSAVQCASAGLAYKSTERSWMTCGREVRQRLNRTSGFDPCYTGLRRKMRGRTPSANWVNFIGGELVAALGGEPRIVEMLPGVDVRSLKHGVFIRGAALPPIGDVNRGALDIGRLPDIARLLKPTRVAITGLGGPEFDAMKWLGRFDELESREWNNAGV